MGCSPQESLWDTTEAVGVFPRSELKEGSLIDSFTYEDDKSSTGKNL